MKPRDTYNTNLAMGLGLIEETKKLLTLWSPPMDGITLYREALSAGIFPNLSAYRLRNLVVRCFATRYLVSDRRPAEFLKLLLPHFTSGQLAQLFFLYTCRANPILADFVRQVYWERYGAGSSTLRKMDAEDFIRRAIDDGKTPSRWADGQIDRVGRYLMGCCADYGLLGNRSRGGRNIVSFRLELKVTAYLIHDLHFSPLGDNASVSHPDWQLFGLERGDVREELRRLSLNGHFILQSAGEVTHIAWKHRNMEEVIHVLAEG